MDDRRKWKATGQTAKPEKVKKRTPIPKRSEKGKEKILGKKTLVYTEMVFYMEVWAERSHICECGCNKPIVGKPTLQNFHHVLPKRDEDKGGYPQYRHKKWNIMLLLWDCHDAWERKHDTRPEITNYQKELLKHHDNGTTEQLGD